MADKERDMNLQRFLEQNNGLVIGSEVTSHYQLIYLASDEVWGTFKSPAEESEIEDTTREIGDGLPHGQNQFRFQAVTTSGAIRAQCILVIEGRNSAIKKPQTTAGDQLQVSRAVKANVDIAELQLSTMGASYQELAKRCHEAESRCVEQTLAGYQMMDLVHKLISSKEDGRRQEEIHQARMQMMAGVGTTLVPLLQPFIALGMQILDAKMKEWAEKATAPKNNSTSGAN
jgi:hypothetical protein